MRSIFARLDDKHKWLGKCSENFESFGGILNRKNDFSTIYGNTFAKNRALENNLIFLQKMFSDFVGMFPCCPPPGAYGSQYVFASALAWITPLMCGCLKVKSS